MIIDALLVSAIIVTSTLVLIAGTIIISVKAIIWLVKYLEKEIKKGG